MVLDSWKTNKKKLLMKTLGKLSYKNKAKTKIKVKMSNKISQKRRNPVKIEDAKIF